MNDFDQLMQDIENEARAEGPTAVAELEALKARFALAATLREGRRRKKLTQVQLADLTGVQQGEISRIERGLANPTLGTISKLNGALGGTLAIA